MADPTNIIMERTPVGIRFTGDLLQGRGEYLAKYADYMPVLRTDHVRLQPVNGAPEVGRLLPVNILSSPPFGSLQDLYDWLDASFRSASSTTYSVLLADLQNGVAPAGEWVFVSDILDRGAYLFCASETEVAKEGFGLFLNADFQNEGTYLTSYSGYPCTQQNFQQWRPTVGNFLINIGAITGGPYTAGEPITTPTWAGIFVEYDGVGVMTAYSTGGNTYPLDTETITGGTSGATSVQSGDSGLNQLTGGGVVVFQENNFLKYEHYLAIDPAHIDGSQTPDKDPAYLRLDRSVASAGYIPAVDAITYDINGNDAWTLKGWLIGRKNASHDIRLTEATSNVFLIDSARIHTYPWGSDSVKGFRIDDGRFVSANIGDLTIKNVHIGQGSQHTPTLAFRSSITDFTQEANTTVEYTLEASVGISNVHVKAGKSFTGKTFTANVGDMLVSANNTATESLTYAPFTELGLRRFAKVFTVADLTTAGFDSTPGLLFFTTSANTLPVGTVYLQYTYAGAAFALASDLVLRVDNGGSGNIAGRYSNGLLTAVADRQVSLPFPQLTSGASSKAMEAPWGTNIYLSTVTGTTLATGGGTSTLTVILEYKETTPLIV